MSSLLSTLTSLLPTSPFSRPNRATLLVTGLDNAGKTTLIHRMRNPGPIDNNILSSSTDIHFTTLTPTGAHKSLIINPIDTGALQYRHHAGGTHQLWRDFLEGGGVTGVVFVVDAADMERVDEAVVLLGNLLRILDEVERRGDVERMRMPLLVLGNKIDNYVAVAEEELRGRLGFEPGGGRKGETEKENCRPVELFMCSAVTRQGYQDGFEWLAGYL